MKRVDELLKSKRGLYDPANEHDACGVGMLVDIHGRKSHSIVDSALTVLENMRHRGAEGADNKTGDGAGILVQIPHEFILLQGIPVPEKGHYGTGLVFLPKDQAAQKAFLQIIQEEVEAKGLTILCLRDVPVCSEILGKDALATEPAIKQLFIVGEEDQQELELKLYEVRKRIEKRIASSSFVEKKDFYVVSLSTRSLIYKGMLESNMEALDPIIQPDMSDSASLDNVLEFLLASGLSLPHAMAMLVPESFNEKNPISDDLKAFYEYHSILMEPWDGPVALLFSDGRYAGGMLDRNGLRPARYLVTKKGWVLVASEVGVLDIQPEEIQEKGRLQPGKILLIDTETGKICRDQELKQQLANAHPYRKWIQDNCIELDELKSGRKVTSRVDDFDCKLRVFGYSREDIDRIMVPMCTGGAEPVGSMGNDTPLAVLSTRPHLLYDYFRQQFAQVTNPPIDPIREALVMSLVEYIGAVGNHILAPNESHCKMVRLQCPILTNTQLDILCNIRYKGFKTVKLPMLFDASQGEAGLREALDRLCQEGF